MNHDRIMSYAKKHNLIRVQVGHDMPEKTQQILRSVS